MIRFIRNTILTFIIITLITTNILTLPYQPFTTAISTAIASAFVVVTVISLLSDAINLKDTEISKHKKANAKIKRQISTKNKALQKYHAQARQVLADKKKPALGRFLRLTN